jgi:hypothetical protein
MATPITTALKIFAHICYSQFEFESLPGKQSLTGIYTNNLMAFEGARR